MEASAAWAPPPTRQAKWRECLLPRPATHPLLLSRICLPNEHGISKTMGKGGKSGKDFSPGNWFPFQTLHIANYISFKWSFSPTLSSDWLFLWLPFMEGLDFKETTAMDVFV